MKRILMKIIRRINRGIRLIQKKIEFRRKDCSLGKGASFNEDTILFGHNKIGKNSEINSTVMGEYSYIGKDCWMSNAKIGKYSSLAAGISIAYGTHPTEKFISTHPAFFEKKPSIGYSFVNSDLFNAKIRLNDNKSLHIGNDCWIMQNATLIEGITIGDGAIVMSGAVVTKDVPPYAIVGGCQLR